MTNLNFHFRFNEHFYIVAVGFMNAMFTVPIIFLLPQLNCVTWLTILCCTIYTLRQDPCGDQVLRSEWAGSFLLSLALDSYFAAPLWIAIPIKIVFIYLQALDEYKWEYYYALKHYEFGELIPFFSLTRIDPQKNASIIQFTQSKGFKSYECSLRNHLEVFYLKLMPDVKKHGRHRQTLPKVLVFSTFSKLSFITAADVSFLRSNESEMEENRLHWILHSLLEFFREYDEINLCKARSVILDCFVDTVVGDTILEFIHDKSDRHRYEEFIHMDAKFHAKFSSSNKTIPFRIL